MRGRSGDFDMGRFWGFGRCLVVMAVAGGVGGGFAGDGDGYQGMIVADWEAQERRLGRTADSAEAVKAAFDRARRLVGDLRGMAGGPDVGAELAILERLKGRVREVGALDSDGRRGRLVNRMRASRTMSSGTNGVARVLLRW